MILKVKKLYPDSKLPIKANPLAVGFDCFVHSVKVDNCCMHYGLGIAIELDDPGWFVAIVPRSSQAKTNAVLGNSIGIIDPDYRGELIYKTRPVGYFEQDPDFDYVNVGWSADHDPAEVGDRICQLVVFPKPTVYVEQVQDLSETNRGSGGFGSTGR